MTSNFTDNLNVTVSNLLLAGNFSDFLSNSSFLTTSYSTESYPTTTFVSTTTKPTNVSFLIKGQDVVKSGNLSVSSESKMLSSMFAGYSMTKDKLTDDDLSSVWMAYDYPANINHTFHYKRNITGVVIRVKYTKGSNYKNLCVMTYIDKAEIENKCTTGVNGEPFNVAKEKIEMPFNNSQIERILITMENVNRIAELSFKEIRPRKFKTTSIISN